MALREDFTEHYYPRASELNPTNRVVNDLERRMTSGSVEIVDQDGNPLPQGGKVRIVVDTVNGTFDLEYLAP